MGKESKEEINNCILVETLELENAKLKNHMLELLYILQAAFDQFVTIDEGINKLIKKVRDGQS